MNELRNYSGRMGNMDVLEYTLEPLPATFAAIVKNFLASPSNKELEYKLRGYMIHCSHMEKMQLIQTINELAKVGQLTDENFKIIMEIIAR